MMVDARVSTVYRVRGMGKVSSLGGAYSLVLTMPLRGCGVVNLVRLELGLAVAQNAI